MTASVAKGEIEQRIVDVLVELGAGRDAIWPETTLRELGLDSAAIARLVQVVDEVWGVRLEADDVEHLETVGDVFELIFAHVLDRILE
jgi:acyl carrier protein